MLRRRKNPARLKCEVRQQQCNLLAVDNQCRQQQVFFRFRFEVDSLAQRDRNGISIVMYSGHRHVLSGERLLLLNDGTKSRMRWTAGIVEPVDENDKV